MEISKHNIFSKIANSESYFLVNPLSGHADILDPAEAEKYLSNNFSEEAIYVEKGYLVNPEEEEKLFKQKYLDFIDDRDNDEIQLFFTPWYACNFNCSYCFQDEYTNPDESITKEVVDSFFSYIEKEFASRKKYITLFGGEPLLTSPAKKKSVEYILNEATRRNLDIAIVTNGYNLADYIDILKSSRIREIQVTIDGPENIHDSRRMLKGGQGSFNRIATGIDLLLQNNIPVNVRMIVDKENIHSLPVLAQFAINRGWTGNSLFKTALGRNYELHHCQTNNSRLFSRIEMYQEVYDLVKKHPEILEFHRPAFSIAKFIFENGELPNPLFDSCSGGKTEWAFDYTGKIYSCTATVGNEGDELGTFYPTVHLKSDIVDEWQERDVLAIKECKDCPVRLACGGGCAAVAKSRTGKLHAPDCRPVKGLLELGISLYSEINL